MVTQAPLDILVDPRFKAYEPRGGIKHLFYCKDQEICLDGAAGTGKALWVDTPIITTSGWKTMRDIVPGDFVFSPTGDPVLVEAVSEIFTGHDCYKIELSDYSDIIADADHLWLVRTPSERNYYVYKEAILLTTEEMYQDLHTDLFRTSSRFSIDMNEPLQYPEADLPIHPYIMGYWLGDGASRGGDIITMDYDVIEYIKKIGQYEVVEKRNYGLATNYTLRGMTSDLTRLRLTVHKGSKKRILDKYMYSSVEQRLELFRGLMDSDGSCAGNGYCRFGSKRAEVINGVCELAASLGIKCTLVEVPVGHDNIDCGIEYTLSFFTNLEVFRIKRKLLKLAGTPRMDRIKRRFIRSIEEVESVPTKCIRVASDDGMFLAGRNLVATHNSRAVLEKLHLCASKYPGIRALLVRKTRESLTQSAMVTFEKFVVPDNNTVTFRSAEQEYRYVNGSKVVLGGMDKASKVLSSEYDLIYVQEATELEEEDWETLVTRNRYGVMPYNQIIGDCNPSYPTHWLYQRMMSAKVTRIRTDHKDNPVYWLNGEWTTQGRNYISKLDALTGVRYKRLRLGIWCSAEGMIYDEWSAADHLITLEAAGIQKDWRRVWTVDFGYTNPFVLQVWAISPTGVAYRFFEIYHTKLLVEDAATIMKIWQRNNREPDPEAIICDWDAEGRATLERHLGIMTTAANKNVNEGIQAVKSRLKGRTIFLVRDATFEKDYDLDDAKKPTCTEQEIEAYEWEDKKKKEQPKKADDHGMDAMRYLAMYENDNTMSWSRGMNGRG